MLFGEPVHPEGAATKVQYSSLLLQPPSEGGSDEILAFLGNGADIHDPSLLEYTQMLGGVVLGQVEAFCEFVHPKISGEQLFDKPLPTQVCKRFEDVETVGCWHASNVPAN